MGMRNGLGNSEGSAVTWAAAAPSPCFVKESKPRGGDHADNHGTPSTIAHLVRVYGENGAPQGRGGREMDGRVVGTRVFE